MAEGIQPLSEDIKRDTRDLIATQYLTEREKLHRLIDKEEQDSHHKVRKPFCRRCALKDMRKAQADLWEKHGNRLFKKEQLEAGENSEDNVPLPKFNVKKYAEANRFILLRRYDHFEDVKEGGLTRKVLAGKDEDYQCHERGCRITIFTDKQDLTEDKKKDVAVDLEKVKAELNKVPQ